MAFKGKAPGSGAGDISKRTEALRPAIDLRPSEVQAARRLRRSGMEPAAIAATLGKQLEEVEKALVQMRMPRPETTRGTLNVTLAAHRLILAERQGDEPLWQTFDRIVDELLWLRSQAGERRPAPRLAARHTARVAEPTLPGL